MRPCPAHIAERHRDEDKEGNHSKRETQDVHAFLDHISSPGFIRGASPVCLSIRRMKSPKWKAEEPVAVMNDEGKMGRLDQ